MRLIDADALKNVIYESWGGDPAYHTVRPGQLKTETDVKAEEACLMLENIDAQPTIEAEPIVRCKDCVDWMRNYTDRAKPNVHPCRAVGHTTTADFFCGLAESKVKRND